MTDQPTLTERAERILEVPTTRALSTKGTQDLIRDLLAEVERLEKIVKIDGGFTDTDATLAEVRELRRLRYELDKCREENARLREHAEGMAQAIEADTLLEPNTSCALAEFHAAFPKEPTNG